MSYNGSKSGPFVFDARRFFPPNPKYGIMPTPWDQVSEVPATVGFNRTLFPFGTEGGNGSSSAGDIVVDVDDDQTVYFLRVLVVIYSILSSIFGTLGNLTVIGAVLVEKRLRSVLSNTFVANLAVADLLVTTCVFPSMAILAVGGAGSIPEPLCAFIGFFLAYSCAGSLLNMMFIALDRYFSICLGNVYHRCFRRPTVVTLLVATWVEPVALLLVPWLLGAGHYGYVASLHMCVISYPKTNRWFSYYLMGVGIFVPMAVCTFSYANIFMMVWRTKRRVRQVAAQRRRLKKSEVELYRTLLLVFVLFAVFWAPYGCTVMLNNAFDEDVVPPGLVRLFTYLAVTNSLINSALYGFTNKNFARGYRHLFAYCEGAVGPLRYLRLMLHTGSSKESSNASHTGGIRDIDNSTSYI